MSVRRSARNAGRTVASGFPQISNQDVDTNGAPELSVRAPRMSVAEQHPAPSPELQTKLDVQKKSTAIVDAKAAKKKATGPKKSATPKKAAAPRKRKAPTPSPGPSPSTGILTNVVKTSETLSSTGAPLELLESIPPEAPQSTDITKPIEIFTRGAGESLSLPSTPLAAKRRRRRNADTVSSANPVPFTPTPSGVGLIAGPENAVLKQKGRGKERDADHMLDDLASMNRPAEPRLTNAPVLTPDGSQVVVNGSPARKRKAAELPPDVGSPLKPANSTTETLLKDAEAYLINVDETGRLEKLIEKHHCKLFSPEGLREVVDPFTALASGIIGQQVSGAAAASIRKKFTALFSDTHPAFPSPAQVLTKDLPTLRTAGLSQRKAEYITGLASKFASGEFTAEGLVRASDEELIEKLVAVRGLGRWSVEMFACFGLKRMDVFSTGDLGVQRGMAAYMGRDVSKLKNKGGKWKYMSEQEMLSIASKFSPYRSLFMWYMWRIADVETEVLE